MRRVFSVGLQNGIPRNPIKRCGRTPFLSYPSFILPRALNALPHPPRADFARTEANAVRRAARLQARPQPELHLLGELCGGSGFGAGVGIACKWALEAGERWELLEGFAGGHSSGPIYMPASTST
jgi:hypothetical protein